MAQPSDAELMIRVREGDREAFAEVVERYKRPLVNYLVHLTGRHDEAEDVAQEAFLRLYRAADRYDEQARLAPYLFRIATNYVRSSFRRLTRWQKLTPKLRAVEPRQESPHGRVMEQEIQHQVREALEKLPVNYRAPLVLREIEGWSYQQIAESFRCTEGTVKSRIFRGRQLLKRELAPYWNGDENDETGTGRRAASLASTSRTL